MLVRLQGEVLPVEYRNLFDGVYTVRLDDGQEAQVAHCDMMLLYNCHSAEASSWVRNAPTSQLPQSDFVAQPDVDDDVQQQQSGDGTVRGQTHAPHHQGGHVTEPHADALQQQRQQSGDGTHTLRLPGGFLSAATMPAVEPVGHAGRTDRVHTPSEAATAAVKNQRQEEEAEEQVVPQLRRTKRTVAQKRLASAGPADPSSTVRSVQRKLSHSQTPRGSDPPRASMTATYAPPLAATALPAAQLGAQAPVAQQKVLGSQLSGWEPESDDELFVDLSCANILRPWSSGLKAVQQFAAPVMSPDGGHANIAASPAQVLDRGQTTGSLSSPQSWRQGLHSSPKAELNASGNSLAFLGL